MSIAYFQNYEKSQTFLAIQIYERETKLSVEAKVKS